ncbi:hypothetical protein GCM10027347_40060 [Larkinella harenae]
MKMIRLALLLLLAGCKNENAPKLLKQVEVRNDNDKGMIVSFALVDENDKPTTANGLLLVQIQGIARQDTLFTMAEIDSALTEANFRNTTFGQGSQQKKMLGFTSARIPYQQLKDLDHYLKTDKKAVVNISFKPENGPVLQEKVGYEF